MDYTERVRKLPTLGRVLRNQIGVIIAAVVFAMAAAAVYVFTMPHTYTATAVVLLSPAPGNPLTAEAASSGVVQMTVALETEAQMMRTPAVAEVVSDKLARVTPDASEKLAVTIPSNTQMLEIDFTAATPARARDGAQAFADGYLEFRAQRAQAVQDARIARMAEQVSETDASLRQAVDEAAVAGASVYASQQVQLLADRLAQQSNALSAERAIGTDAGSVISAALLPERSNELPAWMLLVAATGMGALLGLGLGLLREWRRDVLRDTDDDLGIPMLATLPWTEGPQLAGEAGPRMHEAYRRLRTAVIAHGVRPLVLAVTGVDTDRSEEVAVNLALVLAEARYRVLLIATGTQDAGLEQLLGVRGRKGIADVLDDKDAATDVMVGSHGIQILHAGTRRRGLEDLTATSAFQDLIGEMRSRFDYVVVAAGSAGAADGESALLAADVTVVAFAPGATTRTLLEATLDRLDGLGVSIIGAVSVSHRAAASGRRHKARRAHTPPPGQSDADGSPPGSPQDEWLRKTELDAVDIDEAGRRANRVVRS